MAIFKFLHGFKSASEGFKLSSFLIHLYYHAL